MPDRRFAVRGSQSGREQVTGAIDVPCHAKPVENLQSHLQMLIGGGAMVDSKEQLRMAQAVERSLVQGISRHSVVCREHQVMVGRLVMLSCCSGMCHCSASHGAADVIVAARTL